MTFRPGSAELHAENRARLCEVFTARAPDFCSRPPGVPTPVWVRKRFPGVARVAQGMIDIAAQHRASTRPSEYDSRAHGRD